MKNMLNLRQSVTQTLAMTPQLQQAIRLLQLSQQELEIEIQETLDKNPLLEADDSSESATTSLDAIAEKQSEQENREDDFNSFSTDKPVTSDDVPYNTVPELSASRQLEGSGDFYENEEIPDFQAESISSGKSEMPVSGQELPVKSDTDNHEFDTWNDNYTAGISPGKSFEGGDDVYQGETSYGLKEHLLWQLNLTKGTPKEQFIGEAIIDGLKESGYLSESNEDLLIAVKKQYPDTTPEEIDSMLHVVQHFDPVGVAGRNLEETLLTQLDEYDQKDPVVTLARQIIKEHISLLASNDINTLQKKTKVRNEKFLLETVNFIKNLEPYPGRTIDRESREYIVPDVAIVRKNGKGVAELNPAAVPKLRINETYSAMIQTVKSPEDSKYLKSHLQEANWFIQSLNKRNDTLLKVATCIANEQQDFFEKGPQAMKPLVLNDVASQIGIHESTVSRVTTEKYMYTPQGTFELKYFFSSSVNTENGGTFSSTAIRAKIKKLIDEEDTNHPLSDSQLSDILKNEGIVVARRTIAKYRESLNIESSTLRKRFC